LVVGVGGVDFLSNMPHNKKNKGEDATQQGITSNKEIRHYSPVLDAGKKNEKLARKQTAESLKYQKIWLPLLTTGKGECNHGVTIEEEIPGIDHPVTHLINSVFKKESDTNVLSQGVLGSAVWNDAVAEKLARKLLLALGAQCLLKSSLNENSWETEAENIAMVIYALELYDKRSKDLTFEERDDILVEAMIDNQKGGM